MATRNFGRVNVSITASTGGLSAGLSRAGKQLAGFRSSVGGLSNVMGALGSSMGTLLPVFGAFTTAAGAIAALTSATRAAEALHNLSQELGVATGDLQVMQQVAAETGVSQEALTMGLRRTSRMVGELSMGTPAAVKAFAQLGLTMQDMAGMSTAQQFALISERIAGLPPQMQAAAAIDIFGRSGQGLLNFIRNGSQSIGELSMGTPAAVKALAQLGLTMQDMAGLSTAQQFALISERIAALPPQMQAAAAIDIFGRSGQGLFNFIRNGSQSIGEMDTLLTQLGVKMSGEQVAAIEAMGDAIGRLTLPMQGFVNQFLAELAPAITAVSQILMDFFTSSNDGFSYAKMFADMFIVGLKGIVLVGSVLVGTFQIFKGILLGVGSAATIAFGVLAEAIGKVLEFLGQIIPGLQAVGEGVSKFGRETQAFGDAIGVEAANSFQAAIANFENPLQDFDARMAEAQRQAAESAVKPVQAAATVAGQIAGEQIGKAVRASSEALKAILVGTTEGEAFRNSLIRGSDPRLEGDAQKETADNTATMVDQLDELNDSLSMNGIGMATIGV